MGLRGTNHGSPARANQHGDTASFKTPGARRDTHGSLQYHFAAYYLCTTSHGGGSLEEHTRYATRRDNAAMNSNEVGTMESAAAVPIRF